MIELAVPRKGDRPVGFLVILGSASIPSDLFDERMSAKPFGMVPSDMDFLNFLLFLWLLLFRRNVSLFFSDQESRLIHSRRIKEDVMGCLPLL